MKTTFSRLRTFVPTFNGNQDLPENEQLKYAIKPLTVGDFYIVLEAVSRIAGGKSEDGKVILDSDKLVGSSQREFLELSEKYIPQYVTSKGAPLLASDDTEVPLEEAVGYSPFLSLTSELVMQLMSVSQPTEIDAKN